MMKGLKQLIFLIILCPISYFSYGQGKFYSYPAISTDGSWLVFTSNPDGNANLFIKSLRKQSIIQLTNSANIDSRAVFSPDTKWIYFSSDGESAKEIVRISFDGENHETIISDEHENFSPALSLNGDLAWHARKGRVLNIKMIKNGIQLQVTDTDHDDFNPDWSPDGQKIVFESVRSQNRDLFIINLQTNREVRLTDDPANDQFPKWSPDGSKILFQSDRNGNEDILLLDLKSMNIHNLTHNRIPDLMPNWFPDGERIVYVRRPFNGFEIVSKNLKNNNVRKLLRSH